MKVLLWCYDFWHSPGNVIFAMVRVICFCHNPGIRIFNRVKILSVDKEIKRE